MKITDTVKWFLMGIIITLLFVVAVRDLRKNSDINAADHAVAGGTIALVSPVSSGSNSKMGLILIDTATKNMAFYLADDTNMFSLISARHYGFDLGIKDLKYNNKGYAVFDDKDKDNPMRSKTVKSAKEAYELFNSK